MLSNSCWACDQLRVFAGGIGLHALNLHFLGRDLRAQSGGRFNERAGLAVQLDQTGLLFRLLEGFFGICQVLIGLIELLLRRRPCAAVPQ